MAPRNDQPSIRVIKRSTYEGGTKDWSNRYYFTSGNFTNESEFDAFADAVVAAEAVCLTDNTQIVEVIGYNAGTDMPRFSKTYTTTGAVVGATGRAHSPLQVCALVRFDTTQRTTKNHPIYLFKYYHGPMHLTTQPYEALADESKNPIQTYANNWVSGFSDGTHTRTLCGPFGAVAQAATVEDNVSHRDFLS